MEDLELTGEQPTPRLLEGLFARVRRVRVLRVWEEGEHGEVSDPEALRALAEALRIREPEMDFRCACGGSWVLELFGDGPAPERLSIHHWVSLRGSRWRSDAVLLAPEALCAWMEEHGSARLRGDAEEYLARVRQLREQRQRWSDAAPPALAPLLPTGPVGSWGLLGGARARYRLWRALPRRRERVEALLRWYGAGGDWWRYPAFENLTAALLLDYDPEEIFAVASEHAGDPRVLEGALRVFVLALTGYQRAALLGGLAPEFERALLEKGLATENPQRREATRQAFARPRAPRVQR